MPTEQHQWVARRRHKDSDEQSGDQFANGHAADTDADREPADHQSLRLRADGATDVGDAGDEEGGTQHIAL